MGWKVSERFLTLGDLAEDFLVEAAVGGEFVLG